jgi:hypothetical protein
MSSGGSVEVSISGRDQNLVTLLTALEARMKRTDQIGIQLASTVGTTFDAAQRRAANSAITEAQALARAAQAAGDDALAHRILVGALGNASAASDKSVASLTTSINKLQNGSNAAQQFGSAMKSGLLGIVGPAALASAAIGGVIAVAGSFKDAFLLKAQLDATTASINAQLKGVRDTGQVYAEAAAFAKEFKLTQQETTEAIAASIGVMRTSKAGVEDILSVLARLQVLSPEQSLQEAAVAVKALASGDTTSLVTRFEVGRDKANQMKQEIQGGADAVQVLNRFLNDTGIGMDTLAAKTTGAAGAMKDLAIATERRQLAQAGQAGGAGLAILQAEINVNNALANALSGNANALYAAAKAQDEAYNAALHRGVTESEAAAAGVEAHRATLARFTNVQATVAGGVDAVTAAITQAIGASAAHTSGMQNEIQGAVQAGNAERQHAQELQNATTQAQIDTQAKQALTDQTALLNAQTQAAVDAFLALNPNLSASGAAAAAGAAGFPPLIARLIEATLRAREARNALADFNALAGVRALAAPARGENQEDIAAFKTSVLTGERQKARAEAAAAAEAERRYQQQLGNTAPALEHARAELAQLTVGSAAYIDKQTEIARLEKSSVGSSRAAGAAKISDQARLNNTLLSDQERFQDQMENAERAHQQKLLDIDREFAKRSLEQQKQNEVSKRQSRADFYDNLTSATGDVGKQVAQSLSASYEQAYAQAQAIAQAGNQKLADDYLKLKQRQINDELEFQKNLAAARKDGDPAEVARLEAIHKLRQDAAAEEEKQLLAGGDANVTARDEALAEEQRSFEEQQGKIGTAAEQAAQRKVDAAVRSGKAVSDENTLLLEQETILNRMGRTAAPGATAGPAPAAGAAAAAPAAGAPASLDTLAGLLGTIAAAVDAAKDAITRAQGETTGAVRGLSSTRLSGA